MIPARRWRGLALGVTAAADAVVVLAVALSTPNLLVFVVLILLALTVRAAFVPEGWAPHGLVFAQIGSYAMAVSAPDDGLGWALAVLTALAVVATHLALTLMAAWPPRAGLPAETASRTATAFAVLGTLAVAAGIVGGLAQATPDSWAAWLVPVGVAALAILLWMLRGPYLRGVLRRR
jgi:hypothetical protein